MATMEDGCAWSTTTCSSTPWRSSSQSSLGLKLSQASHGEVTFSLSLSQLNVELPTSRITFTFYISYHEIMISPSHLNVLDRDISKDGLLSVIEGEPVDLRCCSENPKQQQNKHNSRQQNRHQKISKPSIMIITLTIKVLCRQRLPSSLLLLDAPSAQFPVCWTPGLHHDDALHTMIIMVIVITIIMIIISSSSSTSQYSIRSSNQLWLKVQKARSHLPVRFDCTDGADDDYDDDDDDGDDGQWSP